MFLFLKGAVAGENTQEASNRISVLQDDINRLENKIKALESDIVIAKQIGEERRLDKLEQSLTNTSIPALNDNSLLEDDVEVVGSMKSSVKNSPGRGQRELLAKLMAVSSAKGGKEQNDSMLQDDELAILGDYNSGNA